LDSSISDYETKINVLKKSKQQVFTKNKNEEKLLKNHKKIPCGLIRNSVSMSRATTIKVDGETVDENRIRGITISCTVMAELKELESKLKEHDLCFTVNVNKIVDRHRVRARVSIVPIRNSIIHNTITKEANDAIARRLQHGGYESDTSVVENANQSYIRTLGKYSIILFMHGNSPKYTPGIHGVQGDFISLLLDREELESTLISTCIKLLVELLGGT